MDDEREAYGFESAIPEGYKWQDLLDLSGEDLVEKYEEILEELAKNQCMIDRADLVVVYVNHLSGGAYQAMRYAKRKGKRILNLAEVVDGL